MPRGRGERVDDLFFEVPASPGDPTVEGQVRRVGNDLRVFLDGSAKSLLPGGALPPATQIGQVLFSTDGASFTVEQPVTSTQGWLVNNEGLLLVCG